MAKNNLPVLDPVNSTIDGDLILSEPQLNLGESEITIEKTLSKYAISENGEIGEKLVIDTEDWEVKSETDFEIILSRERIIKMKFIREPKLLERFIGLTSIIFSTLFEISGSASEVKVTAKTGGFAYIIQDEIFSWIQLASDLVLTYGESVDLESAMKFFNYYMENNSHIQRQSLIFLARGQTIQ